MKTLSVGMTAALEGDLTSLCICLDILRADGTAYHWTDATADITVGGVTYSHTAGFDASSVMVALGTGGSSVSVAIFLGDAVGDPVAPITRDQLAAGLFDKAHVTISLADFLAPANGLIQYYQGQIEQVTFKDRVSATLSVASILDQYVTICNDAYSYTCRADLGDSKCTVPIEGLAKTFTVLTSTNNQLLTTDLTDDNGTWDAGLLVLDTGLDEAFPVEVGSYVKAGGTIVLKLPFPYPVLPNVTGKIYPGCDKLVATCRDKYSNVINFQGEPVGIAPTTPTTQTLQDTLDTSDYPVGQYPPSYVKYAFQPAAPQSYADATAQLTNLVITNEPVGGTRPPLPNMLAIPLTTDQSAKFYKGAQYIYVRYGAGAPINLGTVNVLGTVYNIHEVVLSAIVYGPVA